MPAARAINARVKLVFMEPPESVRRDLREFIAELSFRANHSCAGFKAKNRAGKKGKGTREAHGGVALLERPLPPSGGSCFSRSPSVMNVIHRGQYKPGDFRMQRKY